MTLDDLRVFVAACESGSLSAVARDLSCSQSAVSQHVKRLERELGLCLLERQPRGVTPTHAGRILHRAASHGIGGIDLALRSLADLQQGGGGTVRVTTGATSVRHFMADAVVSFRSRFPRVSLEFHTESAGRHCFAALDSGEVDLAWITIGAASATGTAHGMEQRPVVELPWVLAVRTDDPLAGRSEIDAEELASIRPIGLPENSVSRLRLEEHLTGLGSRWEATTSVADWDTALLLAELSLGHAVVPALPGWVRDGSGHGGLRLVPIPALPPLAVGWAVRQWEALSPSARAFADAVVDSLTGAPPAG
ncbi:LysR family transcriptional regulator [Streptomyces sp. NPDC001922]|uniref:LysR family transcriptional regulator n=1 Tax=Streptomyces sp. NPDC001922 TaxID=3364624 RepID=UPI0036B9CE9B